MKTLGAVLTVVALTLVGLALEGARQGEVEILVATESAEEGQRIILAVTAHYECRTNWECATRIWPDSTKTATATRCFERSEPREWDTAEEVDCPRRRQIDTTPGGDGRRPGGRRDQARGGPTRRGRGCERTRPC